MIPAEDGWCVVFHNKEDDDRSEVRVVAWDKDGNPMVVDRKAKRLVRADLYSDGEMLDLVARGIFKKMGSL